MIDLILAIKFLHVLAAAVMLGTWLGVAAFMVFAHRSRNPSVIALISQFAVRLELFVIAPAVALQPISGFPLAIVIGLSPLNEFWIVVSLLLYAVVVAAWIAAVAVEMRIRKAARQAALGGPRLADTKYSRLFHLWLALAPVILVGMIALFLMMVWQPRLD
jgi:uncharacterized membrane protein